MYLLINIPQFLSWLRGSVEEKISHIKYLILCASHWSLWYLMGISGFTSLLIPLNLTGPENLDHVYSVILIFLRS